MELSKIEYLASFKEAAGTFKLYGSKILVERLDTGEVKTKGGLIIADSDKVRSDLRTQKPHVAVVLAVGEGYYDAESKTYLPLEVKPGNIVIISNVGAQYYSLLPGLSNYTSNKVGISTEGDVQMIFEDMERFQEYAKIINGSITTTI